MLIFSKIVVAYLLLLTIFVIAPNASAASDVNIDEFYALGGGSGDPDWIVIYNGTNAKIELGNWLIRDSTESNKVELEGAICANNYRKFEFSNRLNNSGDKIRLINTNGTTVEEIEYFSDSVPSHVEGQSTKRQQVSNTW